MYYTILLANIHDIWKKVLISMILPPVNNVNIDANKTKIIVPKYIIELLNRATTVKWNKLPVQIKYQLIDTDS